MPEFVIVTFPTRRGVFMDNQPMGQTGDPLIIQAGFHDFDLGLPANYAPGTQNMNVVNTTAANPLPVVFTPMKAVVDEAVVADVPPRRGKRKAKSAKKKAARKRSTTSKAAKHQVAKTKTSKRVRAAGASAARKRATKGAKRKSKRR